MADVVELGRSGAELRPTKTGYCRCGCGMRTRMVVERDDEGKMKKVEAAETRRGHHTRLKPTKAAPVKLDWEDVGEMRRLHFEEGAEAWELALAYGIGEEYVRRILAEKAWGTPLGKEKEEIA